MSVYCAICCDTFKSEEQQHLRPVALVDCHHVFHDNCITKYFKTIPERKCPICRKVLVPNQNGDFKIELHFMYSPSPVIDNLTGDLQELKAENARILKDSSKERDKLQLDLFRTSSALMRERESFKKFKLDIQKATSEVLKVCKESQNRFVQK